MLGHLSFYPHALPYMLPGVVAVEAFYVISGFLIALVLVEKYEGHLLLFYSNRMLRIYPIYWACLVLYVVVNVLIVNGWMYTAADLPSTNTLWWTQHHPIGAAESAAIALLNVFIVGQDIVHGGFGDPRDLYYHHFIYVKVAWTVAVELSFYAIAPFVVRRVWLVAVLLVLSLAAQCWFLARYDMHPMDIQLFPLALWCFMAGALSYHGYAKLKALQHQPMLSFYAVGATLVTLALTATYNSFAIPRLAYLAAVAICLPGVVLLGRRNRWDGSLGELSYPLYLIHPLAAIVILPGAWAEFVAIPGVLVLSWLVVRGVERPIERFRQRRVRQGGVLSRAMQARSADEAGVVHSP